MAGTGPTMALGDSAAGAAVVDQAFLSTSDLPRQVTWRAPVVVALGGAVLIAVSMGPMAAELGGLSVFVWLAAALVGAGQSALLAEMASRFHGRVGGTAQFGYRARRAGSPTLGALSSWCYWFAWTPGIAVNLILAGTYLNAVALPGVDPLVIAVGVGLLLYVANSRGLRLSMQISATLAVFASVPLLLVALAPIIPPGSFDLGRVQLTLAPGMREGAIGTGALIVKWFFVAAWSAYGAEMASTLCAEVRDCACHLPRTMAIAATAFLLAFGLVPLGLIGLVGIERIQQDSLIAFVPAAKAVFGDAGETIIGLLLAAALILGAQAFILSSSRTVYGMASDGHLPEFFRRVNRRGVPIGSLIWDAAVISLILVVFGTDVIDVVAAANVGYLVVFIILPKAYLVLHARQDGDPTGLHLPRGFRGLAIAMMGLNAFVLVVGGLQWGAQVMIVGLGVSLLILPLSALTRRQRSHAVATGAATTGSG